MSDHKAILDPFYNLKKCLAALAVGAIIWCFQTFGGTNSDTSAIVLALFGVAATLLIGQVAESYMIAAYRENAARIDRLMAYIVFAIYIGVLASIARWSGVLAFASGLLAAYPVGLVLWAVRETRPGKTPSPAVMDLYRDDSALRPWEIWSLRLAPLFLGPVLFGIGLLPSYRDSTGIEPLVFVLLMFANLHRARPRSEHGLFGHQYPYFLGWILLAGLLAAAFTGRLSPHQF